MTTSAPSSIIEFPKKLRTLSCDLDTVRREYFAHCIPASTLSEAEERAWTLEHEAIWLRLLAASIRYEAEREMEFLLRQERHA